MKPQKKKEPYFARPVGFSRTIFGIHRRNTSPSKGSSFAKRGRCIATVHMRIKDDAMLDRFRGPGICELCGKFCRHTEPHHVIAKGMGGGRQLDIRINLIRVGSTPNFECQCHNNVDTKTGQEACWRVIAARENTTVNAIQDACYMILNLDKDASFDRILLKLAQLEDFKAYRLASRALIVAGVLPDQTLKTRNDHAS